MRSKEVEEAIKNFKSFNELTRIMNPKDITIINPKDFKKDVKAVLSYIEEIEEENRKLTNRYCIGKITDLTGEKLDEALSHNYINKQVIRDKIKELEEKVSKEKYVTHSWFIDKAKIEVLKEIIGE